MEEQIKKHKQPVKGIIKEKHKQLAAQDKHKPTRNDDAHLKKNIERVGIEPNLNTYSFKK